MSDTPTYVLDTPVTDLTGADEVQKITVGATAGTFTVTFKGDTTGALAYNITAAALQDALEDLTTIVSGDVTVTGGPGDKEGTAPYVLTFGGSYADQDVPAVTTNAAKLAGEGAKTAVVAVVTAGTGLAVQRGTGDADRTGDQSQLAGASPAADRVTNKASYGDA